MWLGDKGKNIILKKKHNKPHISTLRSRRSRRIENMGFVVFLGDLWIFYYHENNHIFKSLIKLLNGRVKNQKSVWQKSVF